MATTSESKLIVYLIMLMGLILGYLFSASSDPAASVPVLAPELQMSSIRSLQGARLDQAVLTSEAFKALKVFGSLPVPSDAGGKSDPFH